MSKEIEYKVTTIGESGVGKTAIINRYYYGSFNSTAAPTVGAAYVKCKVTVNGQLRTLNLWDTAGQEKYSDLVPIYVRDTNVVLIVFDLTNPNPLEKVQQLKNKLADAIPPETPVLIVGNKLDLAQPTAGRDVFQWAIASGLQAFSVSALSGQGIDDLFAAIGEEIGKTATVVNKANAVRAAQRERAENPSTCGC